MKGFIELTESSSEEKYLFLVDSILRVINTNPVLIVTKELVSRYECSNDNFQLHVKESYEEIKELIKKSREV